MTLMLSSDVCLVCLELAVCLVCLGIDVVHVLSVPPYFGVRLIFHQTCRAVVAGL